MKDNHSILVTNWLNFAEEDLRVAGILIEEESFALSCFHSQQAAEKSLKAFILFYTKTIPRIHSLEELLSRSKNYLANVASLEEACLSLDRYYTEARYPDFVPGTLAEGMPNRDDALEAKGYTDQIYSTVRDHLESFQK